jgi:hypothetical protein
MLTQRAGRSNRFERIHRPGFLGPSTLPTPPGEFLTILRSAAIGGGLSRG